LERPAAGSDDVGHQVSVGRSADLVALGDVTAMQQRAMQRTVILRAVVLAMVGALASSGLVFADSLRSDGDAVTAGPQSTIDLGEVGPSSTVSVTVGFELTCSGTGHPDAGQSIALAKTVSAAPSGGAVVSVTPATLGPIPADWPTDGAECPDPLPVVAGGSSTVTLRAPATPNLGYTYTIGYGRTLSPAGTDDTRALSGTATTLVLRLSVVANAAPTIAVPADMTVEANTVGGWTAAFIVSATDAEDDPDPTPICSPAAGEVLPLGTTTVACSVTDSGGRSAAASFAVTVVDTTAPALVTDTDHEIVAGGPAGASLAYAAASATDIVDPAPAVACSPGTGTAVPVGQTVVTCTASDASGNVATAAFTVTVSYTPPPPPPPPPVEPPANDQPDRPGRAVGHDKDHHGKGHAWGHHKPWPGKGHAWGRWASLRLRPR